MKTPSLFVRALSSFGVRPRRSGQPSFTCHFPSARIKKCACLAAALIGLPFMVKSAQFTLSTGWSLQSSAKITQAGGAISTPGFQPTGWYPITVPATIVAGLLQNNVYADPYYGQNLSLINAADFTPAWWYRTEFTLPSSENGKRVWLKLEG
ncbi:MAG: hypothetical protein ABSE59_11200, partial [Opitutaceae bacterium]